MADNQKLLLDLHQVEPALADAHANLRGTAARFKALRDQLQAACPHTVQFRCDYEPSKSGLFNASPPRLQCARCLLEREEWGPTEPLGQTWDPKKRAYRNPTIIEIDREALYARRLSATLY